MSAPVWLKRRWRDCHCVLGNDLEWGRCGLCQRARRIILADRTRAKAEARAKERRAVVQQRCVEWAPLGGRDRLVIRLAVRWAGRWPEQPPCRMRNHFRISKSARGQQAKRNRRAASPTGKGGDHG